LHYRGYHGLEKRVFFPKLSGKDLEVKISPEWHETIYGGILYLYLESLVSLELINFFVETMPGIDNNALMMVNGFQSWSASGEMGKKDRILPVSSVSRFATGPYGDYNLHKYSGREGRLHSWTYTHFRSRSQPFYFIGSLDESHGYTLFDFDFNTGKLIIRRECQGAYVNQFEKYPLLTIYMGEGPEEDIFEDFFSRLDLPRKGAPYWTGWTSWYNYYTDISEEAVDVNLEVLRKDNISLDIFQIDDGFQQAVGDWLEINDKFPSGMEAVAQRIKNYGYKPGLWLAPFICENNSRCFKVNSNWLLRDEKGKPVKAGWNPLWSGFFYALDFYAEGFQAYLKEVFYTAREKWGYDFLKLDFLYAAALLPRRGKSRGQIMSEVMDFIHDISGDTELLGCGVPLGPAMGKVDYCRIGCDVGPFWDFRFLKFLHVRERISTVNSIRDTLSRYRLDGYAFRNDPDVFILRDGKKGVNYNELTADQRYTLFFVNHLLGGLVFFSDNVAEYGDKQIKLFRRAYPLKEKIIKEIYPDRELYWIEFFINKDEYLALVNLGNQDRRVKLKGNTYFSPEHLLIKDGETLKVAAYQTICLRKVKFREDKPYLLGASGHIFPGCQVEKTIARQDNFILKLNPEASGETRVFLGVPAAGGDMLRVNGNQYPISDYKGLSYVEVEIGNKQ